MQVCIYVAADNCYMLGMQQKTSAETDDVICPEAIFIVEFCS